MRSKLTNTLPGSIFFFLLIIILSPFHTYAQQAQEQWHYTISIDPPSKKVHVDLTLTGNLSDSVTFKMPAWTTGYYQFMDFATNLSAFSLTDNNNNPMRFTQPTASSWKVSLTGKHAVNLRYDITCNRNFVGASFIDSTHAYLSPAGIFLYEDGHINQPVAVTVHRYKAWHNIATGMDIAGNDSTTFQAPDFDILYDSPLLMGNLETLPGFSINGIQHNFVAYNPGEFDRQQFMDDMKKIVIAGSSIIGEIPYRHYTFLGIGPGGGGIEHLNSASVAFNVKASPTRAVRIRLYSFLAHEYFHAYNVKRIRPIELGPFDYEHGNRTELLWVSEGFSVYYEYLIIRRAGLSTAQELIDQLRDNLLNYENKPGHLFQSATQASLETWSDGPNGRTTDEFNKTISYYDKGPLLGLMLDLKIRHETQNRKSLDDVMRTLYYTYYKKLQRGFTPQEFKQVCEQTAGRPLTELFEYASTVKEVPYHPYLLYAGLNIDDTMKQQPGAWLGIKAVNRNDSLIVTEVDYQSPAWNSGVRSKNVLVSIDDQTASLNTLQSLSSNKKTGDVITFDILKNGQPQQLKITLATQSARSFSISPVPNPDPLQAAIYQSIFEPPASL